MPIAGIGAAIGIGGEIGKLIGVGKSNKALDKLAGQDPTYTANPFSGQRFALAQNLFNGRMAGAANEENNIYGAQANAMNGIDRNATDSSQALALAAAAQGQTDQAFNNLQTKEAQNKQAMLSNLNDAYAGMIGEGDKVYQDKVRRFGDMAEINGAKQQNRQNAWGSVSNLGLGMMNLGMQMGNGGAFGGGGMAQKKFGQIGTNADGSPHFGYQ